VGAIGLFSLRFASFEIGPLNISNTSDENLAAAMSGILRRRYCSIGNYFRAEQNETTISHPEKHLHTYMMRVLGKGD